MSGSYPLTCEVVCAERVARWRPLVHWVLVIPLYVWLQVLGAGAAVVALAGWFVVLVTGRWPQEVRSFVIGWMRWTFGVNGCWFLIIDDHQPFSFGA